MGDFRTSIDGLGEHAADGLVIDLSHVSFLDSIGLGALIEVQARLRQRQRELYVVAPEGSAAALLFVRTGFAGQLRVFESRTEALSALGVEAR